MEGAVRAEVTSRTVSPGLSQLSRLGGSSEKPTMRRLMNLQATAWRLMNLQAVAVRVHTSQPLDVDLAEGVVGVRAGWVCD